MSTPFDAMRAGNPGGKTLSQNILYQMDQKFTTSMAFAWSKGIEKATTRPFTSYFKKDGPSSMTYLRGDGHRISLKLYCACVLTDPVALEALQKQWDCSLMLASMSRSDNLLLKTDTYQLF